MAIKPITGMLRRQLIFDLTVGIGSGLAMANVFWYGFHVPRTKARDDYYARIEAERETQRAEVRAAMAGQNGGS